MKKRSRRYREIKTQIPANKHYSLSDSFNFFRHNNGEKSKNIKGSFTLRQSKKKVSLSSKIILPYPVIQERKIALLKEKLPADILASLPANDNLELLTTEELRQRVVGRKSSQWGFEKLLVHPHSEKEIKSLEKILAPVGIYPNRKNGSLTENVNEEITKFQQGERIIKTDKGGNIQLVMGKTDFTLEQFETNYKKVYNKIIGLRPHDWKGKFLARITLSTTMGPGLKILV